MFAAKLGAVAVLATTPAFSLSVSPVKMSAEPGSVHHVTVTDSGSRALKVRVHLAQIERHHGKCGFDTGPVTWAHIRGPHVISLSPGQRRVVTVRVGDTGRPGSHDLAVEATSVVGHHGSVTLDASVAAQASVVFPGHVSGHSRPCVALSAPRRSARLPVQLVAGIAAGALAVILAAWAAILRRRRNRTVHRHGWPS